MIRYDVIVIGGSLAGSACVRELERLGIDAIALERARFPRAKVCGGFVSPGAVKCLDELRLLGDVRRAGAVEVTSACIRVQSMEVMFPFERPGLGISRSTLDDVVARGARVEQACAVHQIRREGCRFRVNGMACSAVIDAAGKSSRFTKRNSVEEFGIQYVQRDSPKRVLDFSFFEDGYGGTVSIEGGRSNSCFLVKKDALRRYIDREDCLVTGPLAYDRVPGEFIAIGDAAGMVDPFCGEGMRHALETGMLAARVVAAGIRRAASYGEMKAEYEAQWSRRWAVHRMAGRMIRHLLAHRRVFARGLRLAPVWVLNRVWD
jgi:flavin-dependent dehydrogenase